MANQNNQNKGGQRRRFYPRKKNSIPSTTGTAKTSDNKPKTREFKFYLHDSAQRKQSENFNRIKEAIILKIQKTFNDPKRITESLVQMAKHVFTEPTPGNRLSAGTDAEQAWDNKCALKKYAIDYQEYKQELKKFDGS